MDCKSTFEWKTGEKKKVAYKQGFRLPLELWQRRESGSEPLTLSVSLSSCGYWHKDRYSRLDFVCLQNMVSVSNQWNYSEVPNLFLQDLCSLSKRLGHAKYVTWYQIKEKHQGKVFDGCLIVHSAQHRTFVFKVKRKSLVIPKSCCCCSN